jgi:hypothetical protein
MPGWVELFPLSPKKQRRPGPKALTKVAASNPGSRWRAKTGATLTVIARAPVRFLAQSSSSSTLLLRCQVNLELQHSFSISELSRNAPPSQDPGRRSARPGACRRVGRRVGSRVWSSRRLGARIRGPDGHRGAASAARAPCAWWPGARDSVADRPPGAQRRREGPCARRGAPGAACTARLLGSRTAASIACVISRAERPSVVPPSVRVPKVG